MSNRIRLLLVEDNREQCMDFRSAIQASHTFELYGETGSEQTALSILKKGQTDVLILDLELEEGNGLHLAAELRKLPIKQPLVIVTTNTTSSATLQYLRHEIEADFTFQKNNTSYSARQILDVITKIYKFHCSSNPKIADEEEALRNRIRQELKQIGFPSHYIGTEYLTEAILMGAKKPDAPLQVSKLIYPELARRYDSAPANIEKAIRSAIEQVWSSSNLMELARYYPYEIQNRNGRPSNTEFISNMRRKLFG